VVSFVPLRFSVSIAILHCFRDYSTTQRKVTTLSRDAIHVARYAILAARDATFVAREALKTVSIVA